MSATVTEPVTGRCGADRRKESYTFPSRKTNRGGGQRQRAPMRRVSRAPGMRRGRARGREERRTLSHRHLNTAIPRLGHLVAGGDEGVVLPVGGDFEKRGVHSF